MRSGGIFSIDSQGDCFYQLAVLTYAMKDNRIGGEKIFRLVSPVFNFAITSALTMSWWSLISPQNI